MTGISSTVMWAAIVLGALYVIQVLIRKANRDD